MDPYAAKAPRRMPFSRDSLPKKVVISYISDYLILVVLFGIFQALDAVEPFHQHFALQNYTLQYPYAVHERVPIFLALVLVIVVPALIITFWTLVIDGIFSHQKDPSSKRGPYTLKKRLWELNCGILGLLLASGTAFVITNALKNATGKPRPDLIDRCQPKQGSVDAPVFGLSNITICTQTDNAILKDGFRSFPSGHSSSSFAGLFYLSLYLAGKLHLLDTRGFVWKTFIVLLPSLGASLIAISRIEDARHHPFDVLSGSLLGILCGYTAYRQYFPPLSEPWRKGRAYPIRTWGSPSESSYGGGRTAAAESGVEPLRTNTAQPGQSVELRPMGRMNTIPLGGDEEIGAHHGDDLGNSNVFRQQVSATERMRQGGTPQHYASARGGRGEDWDSATSGDDDDDDRMPPHMRRETPYQQAGVLVAGREGA